MEYEKMLMEQNVNHGKEATAKAQGEQLQFQKQKKKIKLEHQQQNSSLKEQVSMSKSEGESTIAGTVQTSGPAITEKNWQLQKLKSKHFSAITSILRYKVNFFNGVKLLTHSCSKELV